MKLFTLALGAFGLLLLTVMVIGFLLPRTHVASRSAVYAEKPEQLFAMIAGSQSWRKDLRHAELVTSSLGDHYSRETDRRGRTVTYQLSDIKPPGSLTRRITDTNLPFSGEWLYTLKKSGNGTLVTIQETGQIHNPVFRFLSRFVFGQTRTMDLYLVELGNAFGEDVRPASAS